MKIKPVIDALDQRGAKTTLVHTGQHYDDNLSSIFFEELGIREPEHYLGAGSGTHAAQTAVVMTAFESLVDELRPDVVVVVGDVNSTLACAIVGAKEGALVAHVEAGLRSRDWAMPEEINRVVADRVSDYLFAPSDDAVENLKSEGYRDDQIHLVGNVMIDTLLANLDRARADGAVERLGLTAGEYALVTLHRPASVDDIETLQQIMDALGKLAGELPVLFPAHPRTRKNLEKITWDAGVRVVDPLGYLAFVDLMAGARLVLTDSGGIQEETTVLGIPCLTVRDNTERPITISEGTNRLVGRDPAAIVREALDVLANGVQPRRPELWDGHAGGRIAEILISGGAPTSHLRPTDLPTER